MAYFVALALLALVSVVASVWMIRTDGYRPIPTDPERAARRREPAVSPADAPAAEAPREHAPGTRPGVTPTPAAEAAAEGAARSEAAPAEGAARPQAAPQESARPVAARTTTDREGRAPRDDANAPADHAPADHAPADVRTLVSHAAD